MQTLFERENGDYVLAQYTIIERNPDDGAGIMQVLHSSGFPNFALPMHSYQSFDSQII